MLTFVLGLIAGTLCTVSFIPQVIRIYKTKHTKDLSIVTFSLFSLGVTIWLVYGIIIKDLPMILANSMTLFLALIIVVMKLKYK